MKTLKAVYKTGKALGIGIFALSAFAVKGDVIITTLHSFQSPIGGAQPNTLVLGKDGNLYGTTYAGGTAGHGTIFRFTTNGVLTILYSFDGADSGARPWAPPVQGSDGHFYGATSKGGTSDAGTVYKFTLDGVLTSFHSFYHGDTDHDFDGLNPKELIQGTDGSLYGVTQNGGWGDRGVA